MSTDSDEGNGEDGERRAPIKEKTVERLVEHLSEEYDREKRELYQMGVDRLVNELLDEHESKPGWQQRFQ